MYHLPALTSSVDVLLTGVPYSGMEILEEEAVVPRLPAIANFALVRVVHAIFDAIAEPVFAAFGLEDLLGALAPVSGNKSRGRKEKSHQIQTDGQQRPAFSSGLHRLDVCI